MRLKDDTRVAKVKAAILSILEEQPSSYVALAEKIDKVLPEAGKKAIGNSLRVLKKNGYVVDNVIKGDHIWSCTGKKFDATPPVNVLVPFPAAAHQKISEIAQEKGCPKIQVIRDLIEYALKKYSSLS